MEFSLIQKPETRTHVSLLLFCLFKQILQRAQIKT